MKQLAIVIPAYKSTFLDAALASIAAQTCQDFTLYIGDDCSPHPIAEIVDRYRDRIDLVYHRFDTNLGGRDLVAQWERCIDLTQGEPWVWLFSDDDVMEPGCVGAFYRTLRFTGDHYDVYHFNVKVINAEGRVTAVSRPYPELLDSYSYYRGKMSGRYLSLVVENIFSRKVYGQCAGFKNFDLAWGSDTATWCIFTREKGMYTIPGPYVLWRQSDENISPDASPETLRRKVNSLGDFFEWSHSFYRGSRLRLYTDLRAYLSRMRRFRGHIPPELADESLDRFLRQNRISILKPLARRLL